MSANNVRSSNRWVLVNEGGNLIYLTGTYKNKEAVIANCFPRGSASNFKVKKLPKDTYHQQADRVMFIQPR